MLTNSKSCVILNTTKGNERQIVKMKKTNKIWKMNKKQFWQNSNEPNETYKLTDTFMVTFNGLMVIQDGAYEMYDATQQVNILVTEHGIVNIEKKNKGYWQIYRR